VWDGAAKGADWAEVGGFRDGAGEAFVRGGKDEDEGFGVRETARRFGVEIGFEAGAVVGLDHLNMGEVKGGGHVEQMGEDKGLAGEVAGEDSDIGGQVVAGVGGHPTDLDFDPT
jgi:hypothetical protein